MPGRPPSAALDRTVTLAVVFAFSLGLGIGTVMVPLAALAAGYDAAAVGFLVAASAATQFTMRLALPWLLGRFPDRALIAASSLALTAAFGLLIVSTALPVFVLAQFLQGAGRAVFWTGSLTHAVRSEGGSVERLVDVNLAGNTGTLSGPALGGMLATLGLPVALGAAVVASALAVVGAVLLRHLPPYDRRRGAGTLRLLRRDGVDVAVWASAVGGGWWSMMGSYVPVIAVSAGIGAAGTGWLVTISESSGLVALLGLRRIPPPRIRALVRSAGFVTVAALVGLAVVALAGTSAVLAFVPLMVVGGAASGTVTTLGPAMASLAARPEEQGDALALPGMSRAAALLAAPAGVGALLTAVSVPVAVGLVALALGLPGLRVGRGRQRAEAR